LGEYPINIGKYPKSKIDYLLSARKVSPFSQIQHGVGVIVRNQLREA